MTIAIGSLIFALLLTILTKIPVAWAMAKSNGGYDNKYPRDQQSSLEGFGKRALGAHINSIEAFPFFAAGLLTALWAEAPIETVNTLCLIYLSARIAHAVCYWKNIDALRSLAWLIGIVCVIWLMALAIQ
ncbi:MAPEG family protein [Litoribacillus peritrichatus]|uniref:MAPEG family protein n=1 Tax=Litoribacillus peritrichatus TaxID=718191 RepID=A0ABP7MRL2_9GAMM